MSIVRYTPLNNFPVVYNHGLNGLGLVFLLWF